MIFPILTIAGGLIAASSLLIAKKPNAAILFARVAPYQGMIGVGLLILSLIWLLDVLPHLGTVMGSLSGMLVLSAIVLNGIIGFLLGFGLLQRFVLSRSPAAALKGRQIQGKLVPVQAPLGLAAAASGLLALLL